jgi:hypothetical protein
MHLAKRSDLLGLIQSPTAVLGWEKWSLHVRGHLTADHQQYPPETRWAAGNIAIVIFAKIMARLRVSSVAS